MTETAYAPTSQPPASRGRARLPALGLLSLLLALLAAPAANAEPDTFLVGNGQDGARTMTSAETVNAYTPVTESVAAGQGVLVVDPLFLAGFDTGDLVLVLQSGGLEPALADATEINLAGRSAGRWELGRVASVDAEAGRITLTQPLTAAFAGGATQVVKVPEYTALTVASGGRIVAEPWDGRRGGVVAFLSQGAVNNGGVISASGRGFRGGIVINALGDGCSAPNEEWPGGAPKGEGGVLARYFTFSIPYPWDGPGYFGFQNVANGGGGGVCHNSGGGGGGGAGAGGKGGRTWSGDEPPSRDVGGLGGARMVFDPADRLFFGGGGGTGHANDEANNAGGAGGGIVFIRAASLSGGGVVSADGAAGGDSRNDAASGGGAGGTLYLRFTGTASCGENGLVARGGKGGDSVFATPHGTGGGGGGGRVLVQPSPAPGCQSRVTGGIAGTQPTADAEDGPEYGAAPGGNGVVTILSGPFTGSGLGAPVIVSPPDGAVLLASPTEMTGTAQGATSIMLTLDGTTYGPIPVTNGNWTFQVPTPLVDGSYTVSVVSRDAQGNTAGPAASTFTVDTRTAVDIVAPGNGAVLTNPVVTYSGTAEPGSTVTVVVDGQTVGTVTAAADGSWTVAVSTPLADGPHTVVATARDAQDHTATDTHTFTMDAGTVVDIVAPGNGAVLTDPVVTYSGTAEPGATVTVVVDGQTVGTVTADANGNWAVAVVTPLADGPHTVTATARDVQGHTATDTHAFTVDTRTAVDIVAPGNGDELASPVVTYSGTAEPGATVTVVVDGQTVGSVTAGADGSWSVTASTPLADGPHTVVATARDAQDHTATDTHTFTVDTSTRVDIVTPGNGAVLTNPVVTYSGTAEPGATVTVVVDGQTVGTVTADATGNWTVEAAATLGDGPHTVTATARDSQGHTATDTHTFTVDTSTRVDMVVPRDGAVLSNPVVTYVGTAEPGATVTVVVDGQTVGTVTADANGSWSVTASTTLADGPHTVTATASDSLGHTASVTHTFTVDTRTTVDIVAPGNGAVLTNPVVTYSGTAEPGATVTVVVDGQTVGAVTADASGNWVVEAAATLMDGPHTVTATARDAEGNTATDTHTFTVDTRTAVDIVAPGNGAELTNPVVTYSGTAEPGAMVTVVVDGQTVGTVTAAADGSWSVAVSTPLANGAHTVVVTARDARNHTATDTHTFTVNAQTQSDSDGDGVDDATEISRGTNPRDADTDDDGVTDGTDGLSDTDGDGLIDALDADSDNDGLLDGTERGVTRENAPAGTNTSSPNFRADDDPSTTTDPRRADTDGDGLNDGAEDADRNGRVGATETDPRDADTDDDDLNDGVEVRGDNATNPLNPDTDGDGLRDGAEDANRDGVLDGGETDPNNPDTDQGGANDGEEVSGGSDPLVGSDDFIVVGRGCSTGGAGTFAPLALLLLALPMLGRARRSSGRASGAVLAGATGVLAVAGALVAPAAGAQVSVGPASQAIDVQQYKPGPGAGDILGVQSPRVQPHLNWNVGLSINYADKPLNVLNPRSDEFTTALVRSQMGLDLMGAVGLFGRFEVGLVLPVTLQSSEPAPQVDPSFSQGVSSGGIGDLRLVPKARLVSGEDYGVAVSLPVVLPTAGGSDFLGGSGVGLQPRVVAEYGRRLRLAANVGLDLRSDQWLRNLQVGDALAYGVGAELPFTLRGLPLAAEATLVGALGLDQQDPEERPLELLAALKYRSVSGFSAHVGAGPGLTRGYGTPGFRLLAGLSYSPAPSREPREVAPPAPVDTDGDGLTDDNDGCPTAAEDKDGFQDTDGCADPDNDGDGIADTADACLDVPETKNAHEDTDGCPDEAPAVDTDGDGLTDGKDGCPQVAEDKDGFEDTDGCADPDNDKDGIADTADACVNEPEVINGVKDEDGCPDQGKVKVQVDGGRLFILEKVYFATSKDIILPRSFPLLKQVAAVLRANPQVELLRIKGHTDSQGNDAMNLDLSKRRAASVRAFLVKEGIAAERLESEGYGEARPVDTNSTAAGRENNRRVEFTILRMGKVDVEREAP
jgi:outer membrane protein OmpA-like peptidoglycan-associated protein